MNRGGVRLPHEGARFAVAYNLLSVTHNQRLRLRSRCVDVEDPVIDSLVNKNVIHRNKAARHKSALSARIKGLK